MTKDQQYKLLFENWKSYVNEAEGSGEEVENQLAADDQLTDFKKYKYGKPSTPKYKYASDFDGLSAEDTAKLIGGYLLLATLPIVIKGVLYKIKNIGILEAGIIAAIIAEISKPGSMICLAGQVAMGTVGSALSGAWTWAKSKVGLGDDKVVKEEMFLAGLIEKITDCFDIPIDSDKKNQIIKAVKDDSKLMSTIAKLRKQVQNALSKNNRPSQDSTVQDEQGDSDTISYKGKIRTHGKKGEYNIIPGMKNAKDLYPRLLSSGLFTVLRGNPERYGHPRLAKVIIQAAKDVSTGSGIPQVRNISLKNGGPIGPSVSHQVGLDVDITFYRTDGKSNWFNAVKDFKLFDVNRNIEFMYYLSQDPMTKMIIIDRRLTKLIDNTKKSPQYIAMWRQASRSGKIIPDKSHDDHYHIRVFHPPNSPTVPHGNRSSSMQTAVSTGVSK